MFRRLQLALLIVAAATSSYGQTASYIPRAFAHMCTWHQYRDGHTTWPSTTTKPLRGPYDSLDANVLAGQIREMRSAYIAPLVSWTGPETDAGDRYLNMFLSVPSSGVPAAILYEGQARLKTTDGWYDFNDPDNRARFTEDMRHLYEQFFSRYPERFAQEDGRFVVLVWPSHVYRGAFASLGADVMRQMPLYLVSTDLLTRPFIRPDALDVIGGFAAVSAYGIYLPEIARELGGTLDDAWLNRWQAMADIWDRWLAVNAPQVRIALPLQFAFDDHVLRGDTNPIWRFDDAAAGRLLQRANGIMVDSRQRSGRYLMWGILTSWNEHFEGTPVEPSDRYGTRPLDMLRNAFMPDQRSR
jgi:hypothetical protein